MSHERFNRPFPSSLVPLFQNESKCETFHMKMSSAYSFIFMQIMQSHFCKNGFALRLALKQRHKGTWKWSSCVDSFLHPVLQIHLVSVHSISTLTRAAYAPAHCAHQIPLVSFPEPLLPLSSETEKRRQG